MNEQTIQHYGPLVGRVLLGALFVIYGFDKMFGFVGMGYDGLVGAISSKGLPLPDVFAVLTILIEAGGGLMLLFGFKARYAATAIIGFTVIVTFLFHPFWSDLNQMTSFWKNVAIIGGLLYVITYGSGPFSVKK